MKTPYRATNQLSKSAVDPVAAHQQDHRGRQPVQARAGISVAVAEGDKEVLDATMEQQRRQY